MTEQDEARVQIWMELITDGPRSELFSAALVDAGGSDAGARVIYFNRRVDEVLKANPER